MCGITGFWTTHAFTAAEARNRVTPMTDAIRHRGPDDSGFWCDPSAGIALGHRRLSILDLSPEGHQPMASASGRYMISFNGEVYNFAELRSELEQAGQAKERFRGHSDTEVMLASVEAWGLEQAVQRFVGMFAFALWDRQERTLHLVRDRLGIKPLFVGTVPGGVVFGSELKALIAHPGFSRAVDREAVAAYVRTAYIPAPLCIYRNARKLVPGTVLSFRAPELGAARESAYWSAAAVIARARSSPFQGDDQEAIDELERLLKGAVKLRMIADVPLGAFLSGGIDSSSVVALMQAQSNRPVRTFSIGNETAYYDEGESAAKVAQHLGTDHTGLLVKAEDALGVIPRLARMYDEPFADSSQIPTFLVSELARRHVTVALSGDGGDEVFGGYNRHVWAPRLWRTLAPVPAALRRAAARGLHAVAPAHWDRVFEVAGPLLPNIRRPGQQVHKLASVLSVGSPAALYEKLSSFWEPGLVRDATDPKRASGDFATRDVASEMMFLDLVTYLPGDILTKVDRASMAVSLEARVPLIDHRVVEFAWRLPLEMKVRGRTGKWALRQLLKRYVPDALVERPKMGFMIPIAEWLRGPLRPWAEGLLERGRLNRAGFFDPEPICTRFQEHLSGSRDWSQHLWSILMFEQWRDEYAPET